MSSGFNEFDKMLLKSMKSNIRGSNITTIVFTQDVEAANNMVADQWFGRYPTFTKSSGDSRIEEDSRPILHGLGHRHEHEMEHRIFEASH
jgi:hypothetical protein